MFDEFSSRKLLHIYNDTIMDDELFSSYEEKAFRVLEWVEDFPL
jgi:hypothetical protein